MLRLLMYPMMLVITFRLPLSRLRRLLKTAERMTISGVTMFMKDLQEYTRLNRSWGESSWM